MSWPVRNLPLIQNWDCHGCGMCCREYEVTVTEAERRRIESQGWGDDPAMAGKVLIVEDGPIGKRRARLNATDDGGCVFLDENGRCRIHAKFGGTAKPLACQVYPYVMVPAGDHWRVGLRFACPSVADNKGRPVRDQLNELRAFGKALDEREGVSQRGPQAPRLQLTQHVEWRDLFRFGQALDALLADSELPIELRLRQCLALAALCRKAKFDKVAGSRLAEFLGLLANAVAGEVEVDPGRVTQPGWVGRVLFRQVVALYCRRDTGPRRGIARNGRVALLLAAWRFARGKGSVPRVHGLMPQTTFGAMEEAMGPIPQVSERLLERYYRVKVQSLHFVGPTNFNMAFWDGLESLVLTFPATLWLARAFRDRPREEAINQALRIVDDNFGYNRLLGLKRQRLNTRILAARGELARLVAWYSR